MLVAECALCRSPRAAESTPPAGLRSELRQHAEMMTLRVAPRCRRRTPCSRKGPARSSTCRFQGPSPQALTRSLAAIVAYNKEDAWLEFAMLPKVLLLPPPRGGRKNAKAAAAFTNDRITCWLE